MDWRVQKVIQNGYIWIFYFLDLSTCQTTGRRGMLKEKNNTQ